MPTKPWPNPPPLVDCFSGAGYPNEQVRDGPRGQDIYGWGTVVEPTAVCKHGTGSCEECGTTNRRDVVHTTQGGRGAVGRLRNR